MLTIEQFHHPDLAAAYMAHYVDAPLYYHGALLGMMAEQGVLHAENTETMTLQFYAPFYLLMTVCDRDPSREADAVRMLEDHIRQFNKHYGRTV